MFSKVAADRFAVEILKLAIVQPLAAPEFDQLEVTSAKLDRIAVAVISILGFGSSFATELAAPELSQFLLLQSAPLGVEREHQRLAAVHIRTAGAVHVELAPFRTLAFDCPASVPLPRLAVDLIAADLYPMLATGCPAVGLFRTTDSVRFAFERAGSLGIDWLAIGFGSVKLHLAMPPPRRHPDQNRLHNVAIKT